MIHVKDSRSYHGGKIWSLNLLEICIYISIYCIYYIYYIHTLLYIYIYAFCPRHPTTSLSSGVFEHRFFEGSKKILTKGGRPWIPGCRGMDQNQFATHVEVRRVYLIKGISRYPPKMVPLSHKAPIGFP